MSGVVMPFLDVHFALFYAMNGFPCESDPIVIILRCCAQLVNEVLSASPTARVDLL